jgi:hypothetical protein
MQHKEAAHMKEVIVGVGLGMLVLSAAPHSVAAQDGMSWPVGTLG